MRKVITLSLGLALWAAAAFGQVTVSIVGTSGPNGQATIAVPINLENASAVGGLQFSIKDVPNQLNVLGVQPAGRTSAEPYDDYGVDGVENTGDFGEGDGQYTPGEPYTDRNGNNQWDGAFAVQFTNRDTSVSILIFDNSGLSILPGNEPIAQIIFGVPPTLTDAIVNLRFQEILDAEIPWGLVVSDPDGNAMNAVWLNGQVTIGGVAITLPEGMTASPNSSVTFQVFMSNVVPVKGFQFTLTDDPDYLTEASVSGVGRAADFLVQANEVNGQTMVLGVDTQGDEIGTGSGAVVEVTFQVSSSAPVGTTIQLSFVDLVVATGGGLAVPANGTSGVVDLVVGVDQEATALPSTFDLKQNYPNPFNPTTTIGFDVPENSQIQVSIYNVLGQELRSLVNRYYTAGRYRVVWDATDNSGNKVVSGVYFYRMTSDNGYSKTRKLVLLK